MVADIIFPFERVVATSDHKITTGPEIVGHATS
jgi:hypothetical protein